jgi:hypothetical protein
MLEMCVIYLVGNLTGIVVTLSVVYLYLPSRKIKITAAAEHGMILTYSELETPEEMTAFRKKHAERKIFLEMADMVDRLKYPLQITDVLEMKS